MFCLSFYIQEIYVCDYQDNSITCCILSSPSPVFDGVIFTWFSFFPHQAICRILVPWPGIEPWSLAVEAWHPNHWPTREGTCTHSVWESFVGVGEHPPNPHTMELGLATLPPPKMVILGRCFGESDGWAWGVGDGAWAEAKPASWEERCVSRIPHRTPQKHVIPSGSFINV